jgi:IS6 family transposase
MGPAVCSGTGAALAPAFKPTNDSWRVDETYVRVKGKWVYLYRAVDSSGATIDYFSRLNAMLSEPKPWGGENHPAPRVINTDKHAGHPPAIVRLKAQIKAAASTGAVSQ